MSARVQGVTCRETSTGGRGTSRGHMESHCSLTCGGFRTQLREAMVCPLFCVCFVEDTMCSGPCISQYMFVHFNSILKPIYTFHHCPSERSSFFPCVVQSSFVSWYLEAIHMGFSLGLPPWFHQAEHGEMLVVRILLVTYACV